MNRLDPRPRLALLAIALALNATGPFKKPHPAGSTDATMSHAGRAVR